MELRHHAGVPVNQAVGADIELTTRCNASCSFCPRDLVPHEGLMRPATFEAAIGRVLDHRAFQVATLGATYAGVSLCGLGDPVLNPHAADYVALATGEGLRCVVNTNGSTLDERRGHALLEAGVAVVVFNAGHVGDDYERVYGLPFERTSRNVERFVAAAEGRCEVIVTIVDHEDDPVRAEVRSYWEDLGVRHFKPLELVNRGGSLQRIDLDFVADRRRLDEAAVLAADGAGVIPRCTVPMWMTFIGYDGRYYLCAMDWQKEGEFGTVWDRSILETQTHKIRHVEQRLGPCRRCNHEPVNEVARRLRDGEAADTIARDVDRWRQTWVTISSHRGPAAPPAAMADATCGTCI